MLEDRIFNLMKKMKLQVVLTFAMCLVFTSSLVAQLKGGKVQNAAPEIAVTGESYAVIFGISNYPGLPPLKYADKDATLFRDFLTTPAGGNVKPENIFFKINEDAKAATFNILARNWLKSKNIKAGDRVYIYFSGHGDALNEENYYLLPYDCTPNNDPDNYLATGVIQMHTIKTLLIPELINKKAEVLLIVDACRTNELPGGQQGQQSFANSVQSVSEKTQGEIVMLSAGAGQSAIESLKVGGGHGLFTWYLVAGLSGDADKNGDAADHDGKVSMAEITSYVKSHVRKDAKALYNANQVPVFLPPDRDLETIAMVDSITYHNWQLAENMRQQTGGNTLASIGGKASTRSAALAETNDTALIALDNKFIRAIRNGDLSGQNSAEYYYQKMRQHSPAHPITLDAKYSLATEFINFGQEKINLFLSGKGIVHVQHMESEYASDQRLAVKKISPGMAEQLERMHMVAAAGFDKAANLMEKACQLLESTPDVLKPIYPKLYFLQAAALDNRNNVAGRTRAVTLLKKAIRQDSSAAYNYLMLAHVYFNLKNDSSEFYFRKAKSLAPKWADPENGLANYYSDKKQYALAIDHYHEAVKIDSLDALAYQNIGVLYANQGHLDSAKKYFIKGLSINPCDRYANANMAALHADYMKTRQITDPEFRISENFMKKELSCDPAFARSYNQLAGLFDKVGRRDSSMYFLEKGIAANPDDPSLYRAMGDEYFELRDTAKTESYYLKAAKVDSLDIDNYLSLIWLYVVSANNNSNLFGTSAATYDKVLLYSSKALRLDPANAYAYNAMGDVDISKEAYDRAITNYREATRLDTAYADANNGLGNAYFYSGNYDQAITCYQKVIRLNPKLASGWGNLGGAYFSKHDYANASVNYQKSIELDPGFFKGYFRLGAIHYIQADYLASAAYLKKASVLEPRKPVAFNTLGNVYYQLRKFDTAVYYQQKALNLDPGNSSINNDLGYAYEADGKLNEAIQYYQKAIKLNDKNVLAYANLGFAYQQQGNYDQSIINFQKAIELKPGYAPLLNAIANIYRYTKNYSQEILYYEKALAADPSQKSHLKDLGLAYIHQHDEQKGMNCLQEAIRNLPNDPEGYFNEACGYALLGDKQKAIASLKQAFEKGFNDYQRFNSEPDLQSVRMEVDYTELSKQYFPGKTR